jgi:IS30 family transposase
LEEREVISRGIAREESFAHIARRLHRPTSTVSREVKRNGGRGRYRAIAAERQARWARKRPRSRKLRRFPALAAFVSEGLAKRWSPRQIAVRLRYQFPHDPDARVSHETIYKALYCQGRGGLRKELVAALRSGRAQRVSRSRLEQARRNRHPRLGEFVPISERPAEVTDRAVPGHWEGDLMMGAFNRSAIMTLVERTTRYTLLGHLPEGHGADVVYACLMKLIRTLPENLAKSLTWDQGGEMAWHKRFTINSGVQVYFCDPHSPWQRPTNENTNGLLRQYFRKGIDLSYLTAKDLDTVAAELNGRPRVVLDGQTPAEAYADYVAMTA